MPWGSGCSLPVRHSKCRVGARWVWSPLQGSCDHRKHPRVVMCLIKKQTSIGLGWIPKLGAGLGKLGVEGHRRVKGR